MTRKRSAKDAEGSSGGPRKRAFGQARPLSTSCGAVASAAGPGPFKAPVADSAPAQRRLGRPRLTTEEKAARAQQRAAARAARAAGHMAPAAVDAAQGCRTRAQARAAAAFAAIAAAAAAAAAAVNGAANLPPMGNQAAAHAPPAAAAGNAQGGRGEPLQPPPLPPPLVPPPHAGQAPNQTPLPADAAPAALAVAGPDANPANGGAPGNVNAVGDDMEVDGGSADGAVHINMHAAPAPNAGRVRRATTRKREADALENNEVVQAADRDNARAKTRARRLAVAGKPPR
ncbi:hypothetical protein WJX81_003501 [Elliptochloris bilobata]|uniref:Uncharacterized protein n=1 Tax=Elliptochloris bilobata TaxID=381761 RepID=A0AAW1RVH4_9CHLO